MESPASNNADEAREKIAVELRHAQHLAANEHFKALFAPFLASVVERERKASVRRHNPEHEEDCARLELAEEIAGFLTSRIRTQSKFLEK